APRRRRTRHRRRARHDRHPRALLLTLWPYPRRNGTMGDMTLELSPDAALIVIDVQKEFDDPSHGRRDNPAAEEKIGELVAEWQRTGRPIVRVAQTEPDGGFAAGTPTHAFKPVVADITPDLDLRKEV